MIVYLSGTQSQEFHTETENLFQNCNFQKVKWARYQFFVHVLIKNHNMASLPIF